MSGETAAELLAELVARGASLRSIGAAIDRDSSQLSQVARGRKTGANLTGALAALRDQLAGVRESDTRAAARAVHVAPPARRRTKSGEVARVRRRVVYTSPDAGWSTGRVGPQAAANGARGLAGVVHKAAQSGQDVHVTVSFTVTAGTIEVAPDSPKARKRGHRTYRVGESGSVEGKLDAGELDVAVRENGGAVAAAAWELFMERGSLIAGSSDAARMTGVQVRAW